MSFNTKNKVKKKEDFDNRVTLDAKHNEKLNEFQSNILLNQRKKKELKKIEKKLTIFKERKLNTLNDDEMKLKLSLEDKLKELKKEIDNENSREDINYLLETGDLLFKYYENKQNVAEGKNIKINNIKKTKMNSKSVMEYFGSKNVVEKEESTKNSKN